MFDAEIYDRNNSASLKGGKIGLLAHSQAYLRFSNLSYRLKNTRGSLQLKKIADLETLSQLALPKFCNFCLLEASLT